MATMIPMLQQLVVGMAGDWRGGDTEGDREKSKMLRDRER